MTLTEAKRIVRDYISVKTDDQFSLGKTIRVCQALVHFRRELPKNNVGWALRYLRIYIRDLKDLWLEQGAKLTTLKEWSVKARVYKDEVEFERVCSRKVENLTF